MQAAASVGKLPPLEQILDPAAPTEEELAEAREEIRRMTDEWNKGGSGGVTH